MWNFAWNWLLLQSFYEPSYFRHSVYSILLWTQAPCLLHNSIWLKVFIASCTQDYKCSGFSRNLNWRTSNLWHVDSSELTFSLRKGGQSLFANRPDPCNVAEHIGFLLLNATFDSCTSRRQDPVCMLWSCLIANISIELVYSNCTGRQGVSVVQSISCIETCKCGISKMFRYILYTLLVSDRHTSRVCVPELKELSLWFFFIYGCWLFAVLHVSLTRRVSAISGYPNCFLFLLLSMLSCYLSLMCTLLHSPGCSGLV